MEARIEDLRQIALKNRVITIGVFVIGMLLCITMLYLHKPEITFNPEQLELLGITKKQAFEKQRDAQEKQNEAMLRLSSEQAKSLRFFAERDSIMQVEIRLNRKAIEKIKIPHEMFKRFNSYSSGDWTAYFSALPDER